MSQSILNAGNPLGDVLFGVDNTFLQRALDANLFEAYESPGLARVADEFQLDAEHRVTRSTSVMCASTIGPTPFPPTSPPPWRT